MQEGSRPNKKARAYGKRSLAELQGECENHSPIVDIYQVFKEKIAILRQDVDQWIDEVNTYNVQGPGRAI